MARSRTFKPGFCTNDILAQIQPLGRLLFIGIWTVADREGRLEDRPTRIKVQVLPYDDCDVDSLLNDLAIRGFILRYEVGGLRIIQVVNWHRHQNPHMKEAPSTLPAPYQHGARTMLEPDQHSSSTSGGTPQDGLAPYKHHTCPGPAPDEPGARTVPAREPAGKPTGTSPADYLLPIMDSLYPNPESFSPPPPEPSPPPELASGVQDESDSDTHKDTQEKDSVIPSLKAIANRVRLRLSPSEVAGFIMAHFPMQRVDYRQRPVPGDNGLTVDQVNCIVGHGCTLENARRALEHFKREPDPKKGGAWAFYCLKEELSQDGRIDLREETRSAQREFKERADRLPTEESKPEAPNDPPRIEGPSP